MRINLLLLFVVMILSFYLVDVRYESRLISQQIETQSKTQQDLELESNQLKLEESTLSTHSRIEKIAKEQLDMRNPEPDDIVLIHEED